MAKGKEQHLMNDSGLSEKEIGLICSTLSRHREISGAVLFGSRAKGTASKSSDIDIALEGIEDELQAEAIARELEELPIPYRFDVKALAVINYKPLQEHIARVGVRIYG